MRIEIAEILDILIYQDKISTKDKLKLKKYIIDLENRITKSLEYINSEIYAPPEDLYGLVCADDLVDILRGDYK